MLLGFFLYPVQMFPKQGLTSITTHSIPSIQESGFMGSDFYNVGTNVTRTFVSSSDFPKQGLLALLHFH
jgi:hypothetical protein